MTQPIFTVLNGPAFAAETDNYCRTVHFRKITENDLVIMNDRPVKSLRVVRFAAVLSLSPENMAALPAKFKAEMATSTLYRRISLDNFKLHTPVTQRSWDYRGCRDQVTRARKDVRENKAFEKEHNLDALRQNAIDNALRKLNEIFGEWADKTNETYHEAVSKHYTDETTFEEEFSQDGFVAAENEIVEAEEALEKARRELTAKKCAAARDLLQKCEHFAKEPAELRKQVLQDFKDNTAFDKTPGFMIPTMRG